MRRPVFPRNKEVRHIWTADDLPLKTTRRVHCAEKTGGNLAAFIVVNLISRVACCAAAIKRRVAMAFSDALSAGHLAGAGAVRNKGAVTLENLAPALRNKKQPLFFCAEQ